jgi:hypothetical protein
MLLLLWRLPRKLLLGLPLLLLLALRLLGLPTRCMGLLVGLALGWPLLPLPPLLLPALLLQLLPLLLHVVGPGGSSSSLLVLMLRAVLLHTLGVLAWLLLWRRLLHVVHRLHWCLPTLLLGHRRSWVLPALLRCLLLRWRDHRLLLLLPRCRPRPLLPVLQHAVLVRR